MTLSLSYLDIFRHRLENSRLGKRAPQLTKQVAQNLFDKRTDGTKSHYVSAFRQWVNFCLDFEINPFHQPIQPEIIVFWYQDRINALNSIKSLKNWSAMLNWMCELMGVLPFYKEASLYRNYVEAIKKNYTEGDDHRLPFSKQHILLFTKTKWVRDTREGGSSFKYDYLVEMVLIQLYWFTCSRPSELLPNSVKNPRGLKIKHTTWVTDRQHGVDLLKLQIESYKNQTSRLIFKTINIAPTRCKEQKATHCCCKYLNPYGLLQKMLALREELVISLRRKLKNDFFLSLKQRRELTEKIENLKLTNDNYLFVYSTGKIIRVKDLAALTAQIVSANKILEEQRYKPYSLRIGGTTQASMVGIDHTVILKYVGWKNSRLADCAQRYMRYPDYMLGRVPYEMIHGSLRSSEYRRKKPSAYEIYDPWSEKTDFKFYK